MKAKLHIFIFSALFLLAACTGSKKFFKAAEKLEKQGLIGDAAEYYLESLQRKPTNVDARIKLREVGQKHLSGMASEFFRSVNTQQLDASLESYQRMKLFYDKSAALDVQLDYPKSYDEDYSRMVEDYCALNYNKAHEKVMQKKYPEALDYLYKVKKYKADYKNSAQLNIIATCEPLYQTAVNYLESKNYGAALSNLEAIKSKTESYKDSRDLLELAAGQQNKSFILFKPGAMNDNADRATEEALYSAFSQAAIQKSASLTIINNSPFQETTMADADLNRSSNIDLIQAVRKATGADFFYVFNLAGKNEYNPGVSKTLQRGYRQVQTRVNDTLTITEYKPFDYNLVKAQRSFSYEFKYRIINAYTNQLVAQQTLNIRAYDAVEYQEFLRTFDGNINTLFPYNPQQTAPAAQYKPHNWRALFSARTQMKTMEELKKESLQLNVNSFLNTLKVIR